LEDIVKVLGINNDISKLNLDVYSRVATIELALVLAKAIANVIAQ
jgi:hypothetical protein